MHRNPPLPPGSRVGSYVLGTMLGHGSTSTVYRAYDKLLAREVALKVLDAHLSRDGHAIRALQREARLLARVSHPNVARVHAFERHDGLACLATELVHGRTIQEELRA